MKKQILKSFETQLYGKGFIVSPLRVGLDICEDLASVVIFRGCFHIQLEYRDKDWFVSAVSPNPLSLPLRRPFKDVIKEYL